MGRAPAGGTGWFPHPPEPHAALCRAVRRAGPEPLQGFRRNRESGAGDHQCAESPPVTHETTANTWNRVHVDTTGRRISRVIKVPGRCPSISSSGISRVEQKRRFVMVTLLRTWSFLGNHRKRSRKDDIANSPFLSPPVCAAHAFSPEMKHSCKIPSPAASGGGPGTGPERLSTSKPVSEAATTASQSKETGFRALPEVMESKNTSRSVPPLRRRPVPARARVTRGRGAPRPRGAEGAGSGHAPLRRASRPGQVPVKDR